MEPAFLGIEASEGENCHREGTREVYENAFRTNLQEESRLTICSVRRACATEIELAIDPEVREEDRQNERAREKMRNERGREKRAAAGRMRYLSDGCDRYVGSKR